jgi:LPS export ABC transporter permease LptG/LPS export ABC transporter permease LptF
MRLISRVIFRELFVSSILGASLFTFVVFLQRARTLFEFLVRTSGSPGTVAYLFALVLPQVIPLTIPLGVLVGTLLTLSRMSTDGEITAMRAGGVPGWRVLPPIFGYGFLALLVAGASSIWLKPWSLREFDRVENVLASHELTADIQPRVWEEQFPNMILYVADLQPGPVSRLRRMFMADVTPPEERKPGSTDRGDSPRITVATDALGVTDPRHNRIQLEMRNCETYEMDKDSNYHISGAPLCNQGLQAQKKEEHPSRPSSEMDTGPLYRASYKTPGLDRAELLDDRQELNWRFAIPLACILLAMCGAPLGITTRRAGKSMAVVLTVVIGLAYWIGLGACISLARQGTLKPEVAVWIPDAVFALLGLIMISRLEKPGDKDVIGAMLSYMRLPSRPQQRGMRVLDRIGPRAWAARIPLLPQILDTYVLSSFLFYWFLLLASFVVIFHVFTFFELLSDIIKNHQPMERVLTYHFFLTPRLIYDFTPVSVLAAVLVAFGVLSKHNEITAFKACGISVYRLTVPVLAAGFVLSGSLFAFDHYWVPDADRRQDALRNQIKGKAPQTYLRPDRKWIYGMHDRIYYYKYYDSHENAMMGVNVYELDPQYFRLKAYITAERARWEPALNAWEFQNGRRWDMDPSCADCTPDKPDNFIGSTRTFQEIEETPSYFMHEVRQSQQMNFEELETYIAELQQSGFDTIPLQVKLNQKFSKPLFALIMAIVSIPFAFVAGNRGAMAGVGMSLGIAIAYWSVSQLFEQVGNLNQLPPRIAAWGPDVIFALAGLYFLARMRT